MEFSILNISKFFLVLYGITLCMYHYFVRDIKKDMGKYQSRNSYAVWNEMYWAYQNGDKKAKWAYIFYCSSIFNLMIGLGLFILVRFK